MCYQFNGVSIRIPRMKQSISQLFKCGYTNYTDALEHGQNHMKIKWKTSFEDCVDNTFLKILKNILIIELWIIPWIRLIHDGMSQRRIITYASKHVILMAQLGI